MYLLSLAIVYLQNNSRHTTLESLRAHDLLKFKVQSSCFTTHMCSAVIMARGPPRRASAYEISKSTGFHVDFGFQNGFLDFKMDFWISSGFLDFEVDFWISKWISGFQSGFLDFKVDFWISKWISGFQSGFLDFKRIFGFDLNRYYSERTAKYTHDS